MAGHGGGGGGGGHGSGGGGKRSGLLPKSGCLRYLVLYVIALLLLIGGVITSGLGLLHLPGLPSAATTSGIRISTNNVPAAPVAANGAVAASPTPVGNPAPAAQNPQPAATTAPAAQNPQPVGAAGSTGGGSATTAPGLLQIAGLPLPGNQGVTITPYMLPAFYIVQPNDTLATVAATYGVTADALRSYNRLTNDQLLIGQVLYLPAANYYPVPNTGRNAGHDSNSPSDNSNSNHP